MSKIVEIAAIDQVLLFTMQIEKTHYLNWREIRIAAGLASLNLPDPIDPDAENKRLSKAIFKAIRDLHGAGLIIDHWRYEKLDHIALSPKGNEYLAQTIFSNQERAGRARHLVYGQRIP